MIATHGRTGHLNTARMFTVMRTDLKQLIQSKDFWIPMVLLGGFFFIGVPALMLSIINNLGNVEAVQQVSQALEVLPQSAQDAVPDAPEQTQVAFVLAVYLFAPIAVVVPLTISTGPLTLSGPSVVGTTFTSPLRTASGCDSRVAGSPVAAKPAFAWLPSQYGLLDDAPHRHRAARNPAGSPLTCSGACIANGPFSRTCTVLTSGGDSFVPSSSSS